MTKEEALRYGAEIARLALHLGERAAKAAQLGEDLREEENVASEEHKAHMREHNRANRLANALKQVREILGAKDGESVQEAARRVVESYRLTCEYCDKSINIELTSSWRDQWRAHALFCRAHPMRKLEAEIAALRRPWRPISELVMDGRRVEVWYSDNSCCEQVFARDEVSASEIVSHFREIDPTKPEGVT